jgi:hypothetical protein
MLIDHTPQQCPYQHHCSCIETHRSATDTVTPVEDETERAMWASRRQHNGLLPIARLPPEILCKVFESYQAQFPPRDGLEQLTELTKVCSQWRSIAHSCPSLWTNIDWNYPELAEKGVTLSRSLPLRVWCDAASYGSIDLDVAIDAVLDIWPRALMAHLHFYEEDISELMSELASVSAPHLRDLRIDLPAYDYETLTISIPVADMAPNLACVLLKHAMISPELLQGHTLRALEISGTPSRPSMSAMRQVLASLESLELLSLELSIPKASHELTPSKMAPVHLPRLLLLRMGDKVEDMHFFFSNVTIGLRAKVSIWGHGGNDRRNLHLWLEDVILRFKLMPDLPWLTLYAAFRAHNLRLRVSSEDPRAKPSFLELDIRILYPGDVDLAIDITTRVFGDRLNKLWLIGDVVGGRWPYENALPHVHTVEVMDAPVGHIINILGKSHTSSGQATWPGLSILDISDLILKEPTLGTLAEALRSRERLIGRRLANLYVGDAVSEMPSDIADLLSDYTCYDESGEVGFAGYYRSKNEFQAAVDRLV